MAEPRLPERLAGPRVLLARWTPADVDTLGKAVARNLEHLRPWMPWVSAEPLSGPARRRLLEQWGREWQEGGDAVLGIFLAGLVVGSCGLHRRLGPAALEIGYWVDRDHLRQGIATEAAGLLTSAALGLPGIEAVEIHHDKANLASGGVPRRLGFSLLGEVADDKPSAPAEVGVDLVWRMTREAWAGR